MDELLPMITERDGVPVTTSRAVAEQFGKNHKDVIRAIENTIAALKETDEGIAFNERNFTPISLKDARNREKPAYLLTRDGFTLLAMGFTGAKAVQFKVAYINAFNRMERLIRGGGVSAPAPALQSIERRLEALERATGTTTADLTEVGAIFLQAIRNALGSGAYYLRDKWSKKKIDHNGELLGVIDGSRTYIKSSLAYKLYSQSTAKPLSIKILWGVLQVSGTIYARDEAHKKKKIDGREYACIYIDADKLLK